MKKQVNVADIISEFKRFINWEKQSFENWESVEIFVGETLSDAWILARPYDKWKFSDPEFKRFVDSADGKWLEKLNPNDSYKVILSTKYRDTLQALTGTLVHEMRHCLDYQNAVKNLTFEEYHPGNRYYSNWSEFRAVYAQTRYEFFVQYTESMSDLEIFDVLGEILGKKAANATEGLIRSYNPKDALYYISRYIGASRAIHNINILSINAEAFDKWTMTPQYIFENFGLVFYIGNEWEETEVCELDAVPTTHYYSSLVERLTEKQ